MVATAVVKGVEGLLVFLTSFCCVFFSGLWPLGCGGRLHWLYCRYLGGWGPEITLDLFCFSNVWSAVRLVFSSVGHVRQFCFKTFECFLDLGGVAHVDVVLEFSTIFPATHHHRLGTPG